ncbi:LacI family DNA-binding transcriptional regulator [Rhodococcus sp. BP-349]|uniref:LacI family DNA-binding transcriptional regulator n=1 Tax=unclassified Rhodococcus (in: high G+C Gram-positive bacteria) TaxID=192944 RepID=UPI001C9A7AC7|nr:MULTISPECIES: LacI family DNA-binding transcriptional regulator [unclassified Rhodococcus (in: high G+C Gram-positive bacteria)]MBY6537211.1 LacI family DNA-binding transcriptional regulator [Rhodococcus sp. BP-363]MBY6541548.1 LacI family DNA-binding transcriptional regulator [Rhodococcus sp. BP-369]MBY6560778.1 LacI family DNA-binding transcriptional regulator [Rhodococcus sp. BP-370]MBY6575070.1 LacI family DNA-binding transcriptional regulator [Rhodococcus sp. BP-364]MBY6584371.1 LacI f
MTTMQDVATLANVSAKTVSRVYNDDPHVDPETRARVNAALESLNYVPNTIATSFRAGHTGAIGVAVPDIDDPFFASIARAVENRARLHDMAVIMTSLGHDASLERSLVESLLRRQLSGLVIAPIGTDHAYLKRWAERTPTVFVDRAPSGLTADTFVDDDHGGAWTATTHLLDRGHRRIALVGDDISISTAFNRLSGYRDALESNGIEYDDALVVTGVLGRDQAREAMRTLLDSSAPPTALFLSNARTAMACVPELQKRGATRPAYVGFGDFPLADALYPPVTVIDQNPAELGLQAIDRIFGRIENPRRRYRRRNVLGVELIERESCTLPDGAASPQ